MQLNVATDEILQHQWDEKIVMFYRESYNSRDSKDLFKVLLLVFTRLN
jgi:hypothetical protein